MRIRRNGAPWHVGWLGLAMALGAHAVTAADEAGREQREADDRVIAARCGSPAFEKSFYQHSRRAVAAGLVSRRAPAAQVEKAIESGRRSPLVLVATPADCQAELLRLKALQAQRERELTGARKPGALARPVSP